MKRLLPVLALLLALAPASVDAGPRPRAADFGDEKLTVTEHPEERWAKTERLEVDHPLLGQERFIPLVEHKLPEVVAAFGGDASPSSKLVLLHYAKGWESGTNPVPVLLVHGAGVTAYHSWADKPIEQPYEGLAARLVRSGRKTFALTFAHPHGDNVMQAEAVAACLARIRRVTGAPKVDLVAWSKGGVSTRCYLSDAGPEGSTRYRGDVRRYVMLGTPNGGVDISFAFPNLNYWILQHENPAPLSWTRFMYFGAWIEKPEQVIYGPGSAFPGQAQMVARLDGRWGRTKAEGQFDVDATYDGTKGTVSVSLGIDRAIKDGGDFIATLKKKPVAPDVELCVLAGTSPWIMNLVGERRGPNDGLILVGSVFDTDAMTKRGAKVLRKDLRNINHFALAYDPRANEWVTQVLDLPSPAAR